MAWGSLFSRISPLAGAGSVGFLWLPSSTESCITPRARDIFSSSRKRSPLFCCFHLPTYPLHYVSLR